MKIHKITEKIYYRFDTRNGQTHFLPPHKYDVPFKIVTTYDSGGNPFIEHYYMSNGKLFCRNRLPYIDPRLSDYSLAETRSDNNGLIIYKRHEVNPDKAADYHIAKQERFYEYENGLLVRKEVLNYLSRFARNVNDVLYVDLGLPEPLTVRYEQFYNRNGDIIKRVKYRLNSDEVEYEQYFSYKYDSFDNMVYCEEWNSYGMLHSKTYKTIKYQ